MSAQSPFCASRRTQGAETVRLCRNELHFGNAAVHQDAKRVWAPCENGHEYQGKMEVEMNVEKKRVESHKKYQPVYLYKLDFEETRVRAAVDRKIKDNSKNLYPHFYVQKVGMDMFTVLRPVLQTDATHCGNTSNSIESRF